MIRIENPNTTLGPNGFVFNKDAGVSISKFDPGFPEVREVMDSIPQQHGVQDYSSFFGKRIITIEFRIYPPWSKTPTTRREIIDRLRGLCNPQLRPFLYESIDDSEERRIMLRPDSFSMPFELPHTNAVQMQWVAPLALWESGRLIETEVPAGASTAQLFTGRSYNRTFPHTYSSRSPAGGKTITNEGNIETYPAIIVYGPFTAITISNEAQQKALVFPSLTALAGEGVVIDMKSRSITQLGQPNVSKYDAVDWSQSSWFTLQPGANLMSLAATGGGDTTKAVFAHRHNWI